MDNWWLYLIIGVILVGMILLTIIPQKKRQKQQQEMMNSLTVGTKIMTIGRLVGVIVQVNADNTLHVNVGTEAQPTVIVIDRNAVGLVLQNVAAPAAPAAAPAAAETCAKCGHPLSAGAKFCPECGAKVAASSFCPNCGKKVPAGSKFCPECGSKL